MIFQNFVGPSYVSQSPLVDCERCVNLYPERIESAGAKTRYALYPTPGLTVFARLSQAPVRGLFAIDGRMIAVGGTNQHEVFSGGTTSVLGAMLMDHNPVTFSSSGDGGQELSITSGNSLYVYDLLGGTFYGAMTTGATMGGFMDSFFLSLDSVNSKLKISDAYDGQTWQATQFAQRSSGSDKWKAMLVRRPDIWLFGSETTDVWYNAGINPFPFAPRQDALIQYGIAAPFSVAILDNAPTWLAQTAQGSGIVLQSAGYAPKRISTHAI
jgi:hypothetical protein